MTFPALADLIRLFADPNESRRYNMPPLRPTSIQKLAVCKFALRAQVILRKHLIHATNDRICVGGILRCKQTPRGASRAHRGMLSHLCGWLEIHCGRGDTRPRIHPRLLNIIGAHFTSPIVLFIFGGIYLYPRTDC
jgi:hypothetical protein